MSPYTPEYVLVTQWTRETLLINIDIIHLKLRKEKVNGMKLIWEKTKKQYQINIMVLFPVYILQTLLPWMCMPVHSNWYLNICSLILTWYIRNELKSFCQTSLFLNNAPFHVIINLSFINWQTISWPGSWKFESVQKEQPLLVENVPFHIYLTVCASTIRWHK